MEGSYNTDINSRLGLCITHHSDPDLAAFCNSETDNSQIDQSNISTNLPSKLNTNFEPNLNENHNQNKESNLALICFWNVHGFSNLTDLPSDDCCNFYNCGIFCFSES